MTFIFHWPGLKPSPFRRVALASLELTGELFVIFVSFIVIPAKAGIRSTPGLIVDSRLRGNDS
jgi:hypothetical protein